MNNLEQVLYDIVAAVVSCCATRVGDKMSVTVEDVLGKSRAENANMTRCIVVAQLAGAGYSVSTIAQLLSRTPHAVRHLQEMGYNYMMSSRAYRVANAQATLMCDKLLDGV